MRLRQELRTVVACDNWFVNCRVARRLTCFENGNLCSRVGYCEKRDGKTRMVGAIYHAMQRRDISVVGPSREQVANIDHKGPSNGGHLNPITSRILSLQPA